MDEKANNPHPIITHLLAFGAGWIFKPDATPKSKLKRRGLEYLKEVISEWRPVNCQDESDCQLALQNYLQGRFSEDRLLVEREYGAGSSKIDLVVENNYGIELKYNLSNQNEVKRLVGQAKNMKDFIKGGGLIVLCGDITDELLIRLERDIGETDSYGHIIMDLVSVPIQVTKSQQEMRGPKV